MTLLSVNSSWLKTDADAVRGAESTGFLPSVLIAKVKKFNEVIWSLCGLFVLFRTSMTLNGHLCRSMQRDSWSMSRMYHKDWNYIHGTFQNVCGGSVTRPLSQAENNFRSTDYLNHLFINFNQWLSLLWTTTRTLQRKSSMTFVRFPSLMGGSANSFLDSSGGHLVVLISV